MATIDLRRPPPLRRYWARVMTAPSGNGWPLPAALAWRRRLVAWGELDSTIRVPPIRVEAEPRWRAYHGWREWPR